MNKKWYRLAFQQKDPIHIGKGSYGVIAETRVFIPGWTIWGALVNKYISEKGRAEENIKRSQILFETISCFYPSIEKTGDVLFPGYSNGSFCLGTKLNNTFFNEEDFRAIFTDTFVSTAIDAISQAAKKESLHEIELILPKTKEAIGESHKNLFWVGVLGIDNENIDVIDFLHEGLTIYVGGERRYGFGKMELVYKLEIREEELESWGLDLEGRPASDQVLRNYMEYCDNALISGEIEHVIIEADFSRATPRVIDSKICITPGSIAKASGLLKKGVFIQQNVKLNYL
jgi:hypothetical protein